MELKSIQFTSDHAVLKKNPENDPWGNSNVSFEKPEWVSGDRSNPISHTGNTPVTALVTVKVSPSGKAFDLLGRDPDDDTLIFQGTGNTSTGEDQAVSVTSTENFVLPNRIRYIIPIIEWYVKYDGLEHPLGWSDHKIYVTAGTPHSSHQTQWRLDKVVVFCFNKTAGEDCVRAFQGIVGFNLNVQLAGEEQIWRAATGYGCDCGSQAKFFGYGLRMLGFDSDNISSLQILVPLTGVHTRVIPGPNYLVGNPTANPENFPEIRSDGAALGYYDEHGRWNAGEGTLLYNGRYFLGGKIFDSDSAQTALEKVCVRSCWKLPDNSEEVYETWPLGQ